MQAVVAAIASEPPNMPNLERRGELWDMVEAANRAIDEGRTAVAPGGQRRYGVGNRGVQVKTREDAPTAEGARGMWLVGRCAEAARAGRYEEALAFAERTIAYRARPNIYYNISALHLALGHRDFALMFMDQYQQMVPELRENAAFQELMDDVADARRQIDESTAWQLYRRFVDAIEGAIPPTPTPSARPSVRDEMGD
jgi:tetratricopeptide (TPR) repeat protein